jgi:hypothetical protein
VRDSVGADMPAVRHQPADVRPAHCRPTALAREVLGWSKGCKLVHALLWEDS